MSGIIKITHFPNIFLYFCFSDICETLKGTVCIWRDFQTSVILIFFCFHGWDVILRPNILKSHRSVWPFKYLKKKFNFPEYSLIMSLKISNIFCNLLNYKKEKYSTVLSDLKYINILLPSPFALSVSIMIWITSRNLHWRHKHHLFLLPEESVWLFTGSQHHFIKDLPDCSRHPTWTPWGCWFFCSPIYRVLCLEWNYLYYC